MDFINGFLIILGMYISVVCYKFFKEQLDDEKKDILNRIDKILLFVIFFFFLFLFIYLPICTNITSDTCWPL